MSDKKAKIVAGIIIAVVIIFLVGCPVYVLVGPKRISREIKAWGADAYGSNWLVVQYAYDGSVIACWRLEDKSVGSEANSDGIYFPSNDGDIVHLSGHYIYIQVKKDNWKDAEQTLLGKNGE